MPSDTSPARVVGVWLLVMAAAVLGLAALDRVPAWIAGVPHRARVYGSIAEAERALGARVWIPHYYPDDLAWPPDRVEASTRSPTTLVVRIAGRAAAGERLAVAQSLGGLAAPPPALLPPGVVLSAREVSIDGAPARLVRVLVGTRELHDLEWDHGGRRITLRYAGPVSQLLLMAESLESR